jgi:Arm domain-containing DNA-binding protein
MPQHLTDKLVEALPKPARGNVIVYDGGEKAVRGFGARVTAAGARSFVLNYRADGRERRITIGSFPDWSAKAAREQAKSLSATWLSMPGPANGPAAWKKTSRCSDSSSTQGWEACGLPLSAERKLRPSIGRFRSPPRSALIAVCPC